MRLGRKLATGVAEDRERVRADALADEDGVPEPRATEGVVVDRPREHREASAGRVAAS